MVGIRKPQLWPSRSGFEPTEKLAKRRSAKKNWNVNAADVYRAERSSNSDRSIR